MNLELTEHQHELTIVAVDGVYVEQRTVDSVYLGVAQRYDVLLQTKSSASTNYGFLGALDTSGFDNPPPNLKLNVSGTLTYNSKAGNVPPITVQNWNVTDDFTLTPYDHMPLLPAPDQTIILDLNFTVRNQKNL